MHILHLDGEWDLRQTGKNESIKATVPGTVHTDLLSAGKIPDPYYRDNEDSLQWIGETDWIYSRKFIITTEFLANKQIILRCEGLDTLATIKINSREIARTDNMFRTYEFDVKQALKSGTNTIEIRFDSTIPYIRKRQTEHPVPLRSGPHTISGGNWVRKEQCNYGWDWGPCLLTCGIWRPIMLIACDTARIAEISVRQKHRKSGEVTLDIQADIAGAGTGKSVTAEVLISRNGKSVISGKTRFRNGRAKIRLVIEKPELWWPNGMGEQPLYEVEVNLLDDRGNQLDTERKRIGLRTLRLQRKKDRWGECFRFRSI
ncbi:MAG: hypothetical protein JSU58_02775 [Dehalococcoidales bacterium]|nr:MAG: hypothetical protein JSU58_02775 [Dehalococcoidales bacterium]